MLPHTATDKPTDWFLPWRDPNLSRVNLALETLNCLATFSSSIFFTGLRILLCGRPSLVLLLNSMAPVSYSRAMDMNDLP
ncbi:hypothetical protein BVRB_9g204000 [Beta vulgaris subsp. vulgaris]|nr:hypothetical protein BVRB_9g204000 [Beta vulgaris subsp. vulgaris]